MKQPDRRPSPLRFALFFALASVLWIVISDWLVQRFFAENFATAAAQTVKGLFYVLVISVIVYWLSKRAFARVQRETSLLQAQAAEKHLKTVLANLGEAVILIDPAGRTILSCNSAVEKVFGYPADELTGQNTAILHRDIREYERFAAEGEPALQQYGAFQTPWILRHRDGRELAVEITVIALEERMGWKAGVAAIIRDFTEQKRAEAARDRSEERYRLLAENMLDVIWRINLDYEFTYVNRAIEKLAGYRPEEFIGTRLSDHFDERTFKRLADEIQSAIAQGVRDEASVLIAEQIRKDGSRVPIKIHGRIVFDKQGRPSGVQGISHDITEELHKEAQLQQAQKMEAVGRLVGGVAHDFNNKLTVITGHLELMLMNIAPGSSHYQSVKEIQEAARGAADLVRQLLSFSRKQTIKPQALDLNQAVDGMLSMLRRLIGEGVELSWIHADNPCPVYMDPTQLDQVLANLCVNARDAVEGAGKIVITAKNVNLDETYCSMHPECTPGSYVMLAIEDNGCGMDKQTSECIFEPFFTTKSKEHGTGLGLSTVYGIIRQNNGSINVYSEPGKGTKFNIYLPRHAGKTDSRIVGQRKKEINAPPGRGETVLVVEDDTAILNILDKTLTDLGYRVLTAGATAEALELAGQNASAIDLLLTDMVMAETNGKELARALAEVIPGLKTLFMSGYAANSEAANAVLGPEAHFIEKPFTGRALAVKVQEALS